MKPFPAQISRLKSPCHSSSVISPVLFIIAFFIFCPLISAERLPVKTYTVADGLLSDAVMKIKQDSHGFIWFCTGEGVSRFDGYAFVNFTTDDGLPDRHINDFLETRDGAIYFATNNGLAKLNPRGIANLKSNRLFTNNLPENSKANQINVLYEDRNGVMLVGTSDGLYKFDQETSKFELLDLGEPLPNYKAIPVTAILEDRNGALWIGTDDNGLRRLSAGGEIEVFTKENGLQWNFVSSIFEDFDGKIWVGMAHNQLKGGLNLLLPKPDANGSIVERNFSMNDGLPSNWVTDLFQADDGKFWVTTTSGLCLWQGANSPSVCKTYRAENGLCDKDVWTITEDKDGNLWTGSSCGAKKSVPYGFTSYDENDGISLMKTNSVFENAAGEFFATTIEPKGRTIYRFDGEKFVSVNPRLPTEIKSFGWGWKQTVFQDRENFWWIPTAQGVFRFPANAKFENLGETMPQNVSPPNLAGESFTLYEDSRSDVWLSTVSNNSVWRWERNADVWHDYTAQLDLSKQTATSFVEDESGNLWIGTGADDGGELIRYRDGRFKIFTKADGLTCGWIRDLYVDHANRLWIANTKNGLLRLDDVNAATLNLRNYSRREGLSSDAALSITEDVFGRIYVGTARGVDRLNAETAQIENFTTNDGLPNSLSEVAFRDKENNLWFGTASGLTKFTPEPERTRKPPNVFINGLRVNGESQAVSILGETSIANLELSAEQRQVTIDFVGLGANLGEKLNYEYRLGDSDWTQTNERTLNFANLSGGNYRFEIRAVTADRLTSSPAVISFKIASPIYLRPWFLVAAFLLFGGFGFAVYRFRVSRLLEVERMRTRIATDLHDDIGANLTKISILSEVAHRRLTGANSQGDANLLENIAETSRESVSAMSDIVWAINPKKDSLADLTRRMRRHAEELLERREIKLAFYAPPSAPDLKLDADLRRNIYLIFKESLNNIVRHAAAENVEIDFSIIGGALILKIADDGRGFETADEYDGNGLASMQKRAAELNGDWQINSSPTGGTSINLRVELAKKSWTR